MIENKIVEHQLILKHLYSFPNSVVNIIIISELTTLFSDEKDYFPNLEDRIFSISELATVFPYERDRPDEEGTHIKSHRSKSTLTWNKGQYQRTFLHPDNKIPEMPINHGYTSFFATCSILDKLQDSLRTLNNSAFRSSVVVDKYKRGENLLYMDDQGTRVLVRCSKCTLSNDILKYVIVDKSETDI